MKEISNFYPIRACEFEERDGQVTVLFKKEKPSFIEKIFFKKAVDKPYKIDLDEIGTFVWHLCSGENNVDEIAKKTEDHFGDKVEPAKTRVEMFVHEMNKNRLIKLYQKK